MFPLDTSTGILEAVAFAGLLHRTAPSLAYSAGIGPVVPNLHHTGASAVNPRPNTRTTVPPPAVPALGSSESTRGDARGSNATRDVPDEKSFPPLSETSTGSARSTALAANAGVSHRSTALEMKDADGRGMVEEKI